MYAVGLTWTTDKSPYDAGPVLVGAKLNRVGTIPVGEGAVTMIERAGALPNDEFALYGGGDCRLRVLTSGGFSLDGVTGLQPDTLEDFFRLNAIGNNGKTVIIDRVGVDYEVSGGTLRIVRLSDLGQAEDPENGIYYDGCYQEDRDNYIDIILEGDEAAARNVTYVEIPSLKGGYDAFHNPGGPGTRAARRSGLYGTGSTQSRASDHRAGRPDAGQQRRSFRQPPWPLPSVMCRPSTTPFRSKTSRCTGSTAVHVASTARTTSATTPRPP
jgi:hypothetical protein